MKLFTLSISMLLFSIVTFAQSSICPDYFRRNNGNGACAAGQLKLYYTTCPATIPIIDSVYTNGAKANITFAAPDASKCSQLGYIGYCVVGGNMPPASNWKIYFHNPGSADPFGCLVPEGGVLPITIKSFFAKRNGSNVSISWQTAYESNALAFDVERRSGDGFIIVGTVSATNNETGSSYKYTDVNNLKGVSEYRLRLRSKDAQEKYSEIKIVQGTGSAIDFTIFPNPAVRNAKVFILDISEPVNIQVIDNTGRVVKTLSSKTSSTIEINDLQTGIYRIRILNASSGESVVKTLTVIQ